MPSRQLHNKVAELIVGKDKDIDIINKIIDSPYLIVGGKKHRKYFHDLKTGLVLSAMFRNPKVLLIQQAHVLLDKSVKSKKAKDFLERVILPMLRQHKHNRKFNNKPNS